MPSPLSTRLERALELFVSHQQQGGDWQSLLAQHPDLADVLESFVDHSDDPSLATSGSADTENEWLGDFRLGREVGRGGVGTVHESHQRSLDRRVAVKVLHEAFAHDPKALVRFRREGHTLARLDHPGIVRVIAVGETRGRFWLAMEFVDGQSLAAQLAAAATNGGHHGGSLRGSVETMIAVAEALQHAHTAGIVHRDVKPANILLRPDGTAVLGDFGLARDATDATLTQTGVVVGSPNYMAPEQVMGRVDACDARTDVWALGATLYECITLQRAFGGSTTQDVLQAILTRDPIDARRHQRGLPADLAAIAQKALEKDPAARYQTAQAFADDLRAFLELRPISARPVSRTRRLARLARRQPLIGALLLLGLISGVLGVGLLWQLPSVRAATAAQLASDYEEAMVGSLLARIGQDPEACFAHARRALALMPNRSEAVVGLCLALHSFDTSGAALAELDRRHTGQQEDEELARCRALLLRRLQRIDEAVALEKRLPPPTTSTALLLTAAAMLDEHSDQSALREASSLLSLAIRIAPQPRLMLYMQWAMLQQALDDPIQVRESAEALVRLWPDHAIALHLAGVNLRRIDPPRALGLIQRALALGLVNPLGQIDLGVAQALNGQHEAAVLTLVTAGASPGLREADRWRIVELVGKLGDADAQGQICTDWLQREPQSLGAQRGVGRLASAEGDHDRAIALLRGCVAAAPRNSELRDDLAWALLNAGDAAGARDQLLVVVAEQPQFDHAHSLLLDALEELQDLPGLAAERERWAIAQATDATAWGDLAATLLRDPTPTAAEPALAAAERADYLAMGKDPRNLNLRALALNRLERREEAAHLIRRAASLR